MKKRIIVLVGIVVLAIVVAIIFLLLRIQSLPIEKLLSEKIPIAKSDVPIVYSLGWWPYQDYLKVENIETNIVHSKLNLFNSHSLISWTLIGSVSYTKGSWKPYIQKVHLNEKYILYDPNNRIYIGDITITPIIAVIQDSTYNGEIIPFKIRIEEVLQSGSWGENKYAIHFGSLTDTLKLFQYK